MLDSIDTLILEMLSKKGNSTASEIAAKVSLSVPAVNKRINKLSKSGIIDKYTISINSQMIQKPLLAFVFVEFGSLEYLDKLKAFVRKDKDILEFFTVTGNFDYILKICAKDMADVDKKLAALKSLDGVVRTNTYITLATHKYEPTVLPD